jgi:hypothetical protein
LFEPGVLFGFTVGTFCLWISALPPHVGLPGGFAHLHGMGVVWGRFGGGSWQTLTIGKGQGAADAGTENGDSANSDKPAVIILRMVHDPSH